jgi:hypothetical protein
LLIYTAIHYSPVRITLGTRTFLQSADQFDRRVRAAVNAALEGVAFDEGVGVDGMLQDEDSMSTADTLVGSNGDDFPYVSSDDDSEQVTPCLNSNRILLTVSKTVGFRHICHQQQNIFSDENPSRGPATEELLP